MTEVEHEIAMAYFKLLTTLDWTDRLLIGGIREGLTKFLSNAYLKSFDGVNKYHLTQFASADALSKMESGEYSGLVFEHLVPKTRYIQQPCEKRAADGLLSIEFVVDLFARFWRTATITTSENSLLPARRMPDDWDGQNVFARYQLAGITLQPNPFFQQQH